MNVFEFLKPTKKVGGLAAQIVDMETSLAKLRAERLNIATAIDEYDVRRAQMLLGDVSEEAILAADRQTDLARLRLERAGLAEFKLEGRIAAAKDGAARASEALRREQASDDLEGRAVEIEKTIDALAEQLVRFINATPADCIETRSYAEFQGRGASLTPEQSAAAILSEGLYAKLPQLFATTGRVDVGEFFSIELPVCFRKSGAGLSKQFHKHGPHADVRFLHASGAADEILVKPMRARAQELRGSDEMEMAAE